MENPPGYPGANTAENPQSTNILALIDRLGVLTTEFYTFKAEASERIERLELRNLANEANINARSYNYDCLRNKNPKFQPIYNDKNEIPPGFPSTPTELLRMPNGALVALLAAYNLPTEGFIEDKRKRFKHFIGAERELHHE
ncbi:MAG: hypothetical protein MMC33_001158 [Icmadophila ericetorum]|nr:hypothetical protein [Icmadophila ericetorum]